LHVFCTQRCAMLLHSMIDDVLAGLVEGEVGIDKDLREEGEEGLLVLRVYLEILDE